MTFAEAVSFFTNNTNSAEIANALKPLFDDRERLEYVLQQGTAVRWRSNATHNLVCWDANDPKSARNLIDIKRKERT